MSDAEIAEKKDPALRLPRQAEHHRQIVGHFLAVKNSREIAGAIQAHSSGFRSITNSSSAWRSRLRAIAGRIDRNRRASDPLKRDQPRPDLTGSQ